MSKSSARTVRIAAIAFSGLMALTVAGCATTRQSRSVEPSGFLRDYSQLEKGHGKEALLRYANPNTDFTKYDKIIIESIAIFAAKDSDLSKLDVERSTMLAAYFRDALVEELSKDYEIVTEPGPSTMRMRVAITQAGGSEVVLDALTTIIPQTRMLSTVGQVAAGDAMMTGEARAEAEILDSQSGERLLAAVDSRYGTKALRGTFNKWSDAEGAFRYWAERTRLALEAQRLEDTPK